MYATGLPAALLLIFKLMSGHVHLGARDHRFLDIIFVAAPHLMHASLAVLAESLFHTAQERLPRRLDVRNIAALARGDGLPAPPPAAEQE